MRKDFYLSGDGAGWSIVTTTSLDRIIKDNRNNDESFVNAYELALYNTVDDVGDIIRIVIDEPLTKIEEEEWIAKTTWRLKFLEGKIIIAPCFDIAHFIDWQNEKKTFIEEIDLVAGDYQVVFYRYLQSTDGRAWQDDWYKDIYGEDLFPNLWEWFCKDYPNQPIPTWVAAEVCKNKSFIELVEKGQLQLELEPDLSQWVGYLIHITSFVEGTQLDTHDRGWFDAKTGLRVPKHCPLGIPATSIKIPR